jgi:hypothetical protein
MDARVVRRRMRSLIASWRILIAFLVLTEVAVAAPLPGSVLVIAPDRRPDAVVVVYREVLGEIGDADRGPTLTVYGDGRMVAHYPRYMKRAGDWERRLTASELDGLLASLAAKGVLDFDAPTVRAAARASLLASRERARAANAPIELFEASDASTTVIDIALARYEPASPGARAVERLAKRVAWTALRTDAERHPDVPALRDLAAAEQELRTLREHPAFTRVR